MSTICHYCKRPYTEAEIAKKKQARTNNARASIKKMRANGTRIGRAKERNDKLIRKLRDEKGYSIKKIADIVGFSKSVVHRSLQETK